MKYIICSDIHGDIECARDAFLAKNKECADKMILLGDLLYHGPRNDLPSSYAPKEVIELLNANSANLLAVRGNCDTEVDQMVLSFPILADYAYIEIDGLRIFATHGHRHSPENHPHLLPGEILLTGHTHIPAIEEIGGGVFYVNPGSVTLPKGGFKRSYATLENRKIEIKDFDGNVIFERTF